MEGGTSRFFYLRASQSPTWPNKTITKVQSIRVKTQSEDREKGRIYNLKNS